MIDIPIVLLVTNSKKLVDCNICSVGGEDFGKYIGIMKVGGSVIVYGATGLLSRVFLDSFIAGLPSTFSIHRLFLTHLKIIGTSMGSDR